MSNLTAVAYIVQSRDPDTGDWRDEMTYEPKYRTVLRSKVKWFLWWHWEVVTPCVVNEFPAAKSAYNCAITWAKYRKMRVPDMNIRVRVKVKHNNPPHHPLVSDRRTLYTLWENGEWAE